MTPIKWCDCYSKVIPDKPCGCGRDFCFCRLYLAYHNIHWRGGHWKIECAFRKLNEELEQCHEKENRQETN